MHYNSLRIKIIWTQNFVTIPYIIKSPTFYREADVFH